MTAYAEAQPVYLLAGWPSVLPLPSGKKQTPPKGFTGRTGIDPDGEQHRQWLANQPHGNVALRMPYSVIGIDVDAYGSKRGQQTLADRERKWGQLPATWRSTSRTDDPVSGIRYFRVPVDRHWRDVGPDVETIWWGHRYSLVWPSTHPDTGATYSWRGPDGLLSEPPAVAELPQLPKAWVDGLTREPAQRRASHSAALPPERTNSWAEAGLQAEVDKVRAAANGSRDTTLNTAAYSVGQLVGGGFLNEESATEALVAAGLATGQEEALVNKTVKHAMADGAANPRTGPAAKTDEDDGRVPLDDSPLAQWVADRLGDRFCWAGGLGWLAYDGKVWRPATDATVTEAVRTEFRELNKREIDECTDVQRLKRLPDLLRAGKIRAVVGLMRGIIEVDSAAFDQHPDLLNVANGVVDLRSGRLRDHDPALRLTKISPTKFVPGASHPDWDQALKALPSEVADWMQWRFGQAASGHATPDQLLPVLYGNGANGKSTLLTGITGSLGDHAVSVPERVLLANPTDHPTELMTLRGARMAVIEETPEARHLSVKRLKDTVGTPKITARKIRQDNVEWTASHSLFLGA